MLCFSYFPYYKRIPKAIKLKIGKVYFVYQLHSLNHGLLGLCFGAYGEVVNYGKEQAVYIFMAEKQKYRQRKGEGSPNPFQCDAPSNLTSFHKAPAPTVTTGSQ